MSKEDLDNADLVDWFVDEHFEDFFDFLVETFDSVEIRKKFCSSRSNKFMEFKSKWEEDQFDQLAEKANDEWKTFKH